MKKNTFVISILLVFLMSCVLTVSAFAQGKDEVTSSMRDRHPELQAAKDSGYAGEAWTGLVALVDSDAPSAIQTLVNAENNDRRMLFQIIARETGTSIEEVARQNRIRMYRLAGENHFLQDQNRQWVRKTDLNP